MRLTPSLITFLICCNRTLISSVMSRTLDSYIQMFEMLDYDTNDVHDRHRRSLSTGRNRYRKEILTLDITAYNRTLGLRLTPDDITFDPDADHKSGTEILPLDLSHLYHGHIAGDVQSKVYGYIIDGLFQGKIALSDGEVFYVERKEKYRRDAELQSIEAVHSVIYREKDVQDPHNIRKDPHAFCGNSKLSNQRWMAEFLKRRQKRDSVREMNPVDIKADDTLGEENGRVRFSPGTYFHLEQAGKAPAVDDPRLTCPVQMMGGPLLWDHYTLIGKTPQGTRMEITGLFQFLVRELNTLIEAETFTSSSGIGYRGLNVRIGRVLINTSDDCASSRTRHAFCGQGIDESNLLNLLGKTPGHHEYCHSHLITVRDFNEGTVGLSWVGHTGAAGICSAKNTSRSALNTALTTLMNFGALMPGSLLRLVFAHEFGHNAGSEHDNKDSRECAPKSSGGPNADNGNYIMFPAAQDGFSLNNRKWSPCSKRAIGDLIESRKRSRASCFIGRSAGFCGNSVIDEDEECDCGFLSDCLSEDDCCRCCNGRRTERTDKMCKLKDGVSCDPAQGPCCTSSCGFHTTDIVCREESECAGVVYCPSNSSTCPPGSPKPDNKRCNQNTQICRNGECVGSICQLIVSDSQNWTACVASKEAIIGLPCYVSCKLEGSNSCWSSTEMDQPDFPPSFKRLLDSIDAGSIKLPAGSPCDDYKGFCDVFQKCKQLYTLGPLARLATQLFSKGTLQIILDNAKTYWYLVFGGFMALVIFTASFVKICAVYTPTSNPDKQLANRESRQIHSLFIKKKKIVKKMLHELDTVEKIEADALKEEQEKEQKILVAIDQIINNMVQTGDLKIGNHSSSKMDVIQDASGMLEGTNYTPADQAYPGPTLQIPNRYQINSQTASATNVRRGRNNS